VAKRYSLYCRGVLFFSTSQRYAFEQMKQALVTAGHHYDDFEEELADDFRRNDHG
jgi:hypothetical protein